MTFRHVCFWELMWDNEKDCNHLTNYHLLSGIHAILVKVFLDSIRLERINIVAQTILALGHVNIYPTMHCFGNPRLTQSMIAYYDFD